MRNMELSRTIDKKEIAQIFSDKCRFLNMFLVMTIVSGHVTFYSGGCDWLTDVFQKSTMGTMGWFFFISAFWYFKGYSKEAIIYKFVSRIRSLFIPYICFNFIAVCMQFKQLAQNSIGFKSLLENVLMSFVFISTNYYETLPSDNPTWYIIRLLSYFLVAPAIYFLMKNKIVGIFTLICVFYFTLNGSYYHFNGFFFIFCFGAYISMHLRNEFIDLFTRCIFIRNTYLGLGLFVLMYGLVSFLLIRLFNNIWSPLMVMSTVIQMLITFVCSLFMKLPHLKPEWGGYSFLVFCGHILLVIPLKVVFDKIDGIIGMNFPGIRTIFMCLLIMVIIILISKVMNKYIPKLYRFISGSR